MSQTSDFVTSEHSRERGSVLLVSIVILLVLTIAGIATMRTTIRQERMSFNDRDGLIAQQAAEIALRSGEIWVNDQTVLPHELLCIGGTGSACRGPNFPGVFVVSPAEPRFDETADFLALTSQQWALDGEPLANGGAAVTVTGAATQPVFIVREGVILRDSLTLGRGDETRRYLYEITALGVGNEPESQRVLQSTFIRRF